MQPMQPTQPAHPAKKVSAFRIGLLFGIILAVIMIAFNFAEQFAKDVIGAGGLILTILTIIISLAAYFFAGFRASSQSGKVSTGLLAGMWTGIISSLVNGIASVLLTIPQLPELTRTANQAIIDSGAQTDIRYTETTMLALTIGGTFLLLLLASAIALGVGAIGGAAGKSRAPMSQQAYQEAFYQSPMGGYPPPQPGYPQQPQGGYPGYPPQPGAYSPPQSPPQQPPQPGYPPQPGQYPPESGGYPPQQ
jgi:hypothetical protein